MILTENPHKEKSPQFPKEKRKDILKDLILFNIYELLEGLGTSILITEEVQDAAKFKS